MLRPLISKKNGDQELGGRWGLGRQHWGMDWGQGVGMESAP